MKKILKSLFVVVMLMVTVLSLTSCKNDVTQVGILKLATHSALDAAEAGIVEGLRENGFVDGENINIRYQNPQGDPSNLALAAETLVKKCDIIFVIATPAAITLKAEMENQGRDIPIIFTAVTDAVEAGLVASNEKPGGNITGTHDMNPVADQIDLAKELNPSIKKIGTIYTSSEVNSKVQIDIAIEHAESIGLAVEEATINTVNDIQDVIQSLVNKGIEALYIPTDNTLSAAMSAVEPILRQAGIPSICGEAGMVHNGGTVTYGIDYHALGKLTGSMGSKILKGEATCADTPVVTCPFEDIQLSVNKKAALQAGITIPEALLNKADEVIE